jgi:hypothetical protein
MYPKYVPVLEHTSFWARVAALREHYGLAIIEEQNLVRYMRAAEYPVHEPINAYLLGIGDFEDPTGSKHQVKVLRLPSAAQFDGMTGFFGPAVKYGLYCMAFHEIR